MILRVFLITMMLLATETMASPKDATQSWRRLTTHLAISYIPIGAIEFTNDNSSYDIYDNLAYRVSVEYFVSDLVSIGPAFEYLKKNVNPYAYFDEDVALYGYYLDCRFNHSLTDSGGSFLIFGLGTGINALKEAGGMSGSGFNIYGTVGLDIALFPSVGLDLLYKYQTNRITVDDRIYKFEGSAIQTGLSYRFRF